MPFHLMGDTTQRRTRLLINGETYTGKTHSLLTFPAPRYVMMYPGEGGYDTLSAEKSESTLVTVYSAAKIEKEPNSAKVIEDVWTETVRALAIPGLQTFSGDGLHCLMEYVMDAMSGGAFFEGLKVGDSNSAEETLPPAVWGQADRWMKGYLNLVKMSTVPYVVFTSWDGDKRLRKQGRGEHWSQVPTAKLPALLGPLARNILGQFTVTLHSSRGKLDPNDAKATWRWQTKPDGLVLGCGIKGPAALVGEIPKFIPQDWAVLASYLGVKEGKVHE